MVWDAEVWAELHKIRAGIRLINQLTWFFNQSILVEFISNVYQLVSPKLLFLSPKEKFLTSFLLNLKSEF